MLKDNLKKLRESRKLTKKEVANGTGITERAYIAYEYGERDVSTETLIKLADFYGVTTDYLLGRNTEIDIDPIEILSVVADFTELEKNFLSLYVSYNREERIQFLNKLTKDLKSAITKAEAELENN